jgi:hypothetical protein
MRTDATAATATNHESQPPRNAPRASHMSGGGSASTPGRAIAKPCGHSDGDATIVAAPSRMSDRRPPGSSAMRTAAADSATKAARGMS